MSCPPRARCRRPYVHATARWSSVADLSPSQRLSTPTTRLPHQGFRASPRLSTRPGAPARAARHTRNAGPPPPRHRGDIALDDRNDDGPPHPRPPPHRRAGRVHGAARRPPRSGSRRGARPADAAPHPAGLCPRPDPCSRPAVPCRQPDPVPTAFATPEPAPGPGAAQDPQVVRVPQGAPATGGGSTEGPDAALVAIGAIGLAGAAGAAGAAVTRRRRNPAAD